MPNVKLGSISTSFLNGDTVKEVIADTNAINNLLDTYPVGSGKYGVLRTTEERMSYIEKDLSEEALNSLEGQNFLAALDKLKALHKSEANIKSAIKIKAGVTTKKIEEEKKERYEEQREFMNIPPLKESGLNFIPILLGIGAITGAYFLIKG